MKTKTLLALVVLAHALGHPLVHALPSLSVAAEQVQRPSSSPQPQTKINGGVPCAACVAHRFLPTVPVVISAVQPNWQSLLLAPPTRVSSFLALARPARAPPQA